jgi:acetolactate synthase-1/2/3 large subunit
MTVPRLALEVWDAIKGEDWVLTAGDLGSWGKKLWNFDRPYCHAGRELGTGTQIGLSLGVALANKGTGRLVVDLQPDGDLMFDAGSLWIAAKYQIPMLVVMFNNRAYYNDWNHQLVLAKTRGTDPSRAHIGMDLYGPDPDFAGLAKSMGWYSEGPFENGDDLKPALKRAIEQVKQGKPARRCLRSKSRVMSSIFHAPLCAGGYFTAKVNETQNIQLTLILIRSVMLESPMPNTAVHQLWKCE